MQITILKLLACASIIALGFCPRATAQKDTDKGATNAEKIVGTWQLVKAGNKGVSKGIEVTFEFTKDGKVKISGPENDEGTYKVEGDKFFMTFKSNGKTVRSLIKSLTADTFVFEDDSKGKTVIVEMKRK